MIHLLVLCVGMYNQNVCSKTHSRDVSIVCILTIKQVLSVTAICPQPGIVRNLATFFGRSSEPSAQQDNQWTIAKSAYTKQRYTYSN